ncbi:MAG: nickel-dependent hydrogenase large subunit [Phycisphaerae bacterium]
MSQTYRIGPVTRIEGHLEIEVTVDKPDSQYTVTAAKSAGMMYRGFENILHGRNPRDATHLTQRICGVCPISHGMASSLAMEAAFGVTAPNNGRIIRNLVLGANFLQSHILHFYHLMALDFVNTTGLLDLSPWTPRIVSPDMIKGSVATRLVNHYVQALAIRRMAHQMGAIFGGRMPCSPIFVPGGSTEIVDAAKVAAFSQLLTTIRRFINLVYIPDMQTLARAFPQYYTIGQGCGNLLAYGVFDLNSAGTAKLLARGRYTDGAIGTVDPAQIKEYVGNSWYTAASGNLNPSAGVTQPQSGKAAGYSWLKAPRYLDKVHEVGPLARMWVNGDYRRGISVMDRIVARAYEAKKIGTAMAQWLTQLVVGASSYNYKDIPSSTASVAVGLTEAPRGALGHWLSISNRVVGRYQIVTPTNWNASPADDAGLNGAIEQALIGARVSDMTAPIELLRIVHSFDPCLSCAVHMITPDRRRSVVVSA